MHDAIALKHEMGVTGSSCEFLLGLGTANAIYV